MNRRSKYATLDVRIVKACSNPYARGISHRRIYVDGAGVAEEIGRLKVGEYGAGFSLLSRRLQSLRQRGILTRMPCSQRWRLAGLPFLQASHV